MALEAEAVVTGISTHESTPASESKFMAPIWRLSMEVRPWPISYLIAPLSTDKPLLKVVVALNVPVSIVKMELLVVVANVVGDAVAM